MSHLCACASVTLPRESKHMSRLFGGLTRTVELPSFGGNFIVCQLGQGCCHQAGKKWCHCDSAVVYHGPNNGGLSLGSLSFRTYWHHVTLCKACMEPSQSISILCVSCWHPVLGRPLEMSHQQAPDSKSFMGLK